MSTASPGRLGVEITQEALPADLLEGLEEAVLASCAASTALQGAMRASFEVRSVGRIAVAEVLTNESVALQVSGHALEPASLFVWLQLRGVARVEQSGSNADLGSGDLCFLRSSAPTELTLSTGQVLLVALPETEIADRFPLWRSALARTISGAGGAPAVFLDALRSLCRWRDAIDELSGESIADAIVDLVGAVLCFGAPDDQGCVDRVLYQRQRVKRFARQHLRDPQLSVPLIADRLELSPRQIHRLFANEPMSLMRWIWAERLNQCHRELTSNTSEQRPLSDIAYAWGFNDQAHFSRAYRQRFGLSPREARRKAVAEDSSAS